MGTPGLLPAVRHYIALINGARVYARLTPRQVDSFHKLSPFAPIDIGRDGNAWFQVSEEIAREWTAEEDA